jgi:hypothetical protein
LASSGAAGIRGALGQEKAVGWAPPGPGLTGGQAQAHTGAQARVQQETDEALREHDGDRPEDTQALQVLRDAARFRRAHSDRSHHPVAKGDDDRLYSWLLRNAGMPRGGDDSLREFVLEAVAGILGITLPEAPLPGGRAPEGLQDAADQQGLDAGQVTELARRWLLPGPGPARDVTDPGLHALIATAAAAAKPATPSTSSPSPCTSCPPACEQELPRNRAALPGTWPARGPPGSTSRSSTRSATTPADREDLAATITAALPPLTTTTATPAPGATTLTLIQYPHGYLPTAPPPPWAQSIITLLKEQIDATPARADSTASPDSTASTASPPAGPG